MSLPENQWNYEEFITFLLIYAAHADIEFSEEESTFIKEYSGEDSYQKILEAYEDMTEFEILEVLKSYKTIHYPDDESKSKMLETMKELFHVDGHYSPMEKTLSIFLEYLL